MCRDSAGGGKEAATVLALMESVIILWTRKLKLMKDPCEAEPSGTERPPVRAGGHLHSPLLQPPPFTGEETEAQRGKVTCLGSQSRETAEPALRCRVSTGCCHWWWWREGSALFPRVHTQVYCVQLCSVCTAQRYLTEHKCRWAHPTVRPQSFLNPLLLPSLTPAAS